VSSRNNGKWGKRSFIMLRHDILRHDNFKTLDGNSTKLLIDLYSQFNGKNNGDFCAPWSVMCERGWRSKATLYRSTKTLMNRGLIIKTRQGGQHKASLYGVTWEPIDDCEGKLDISSTKIAGNEWKTAVEKQILGTHREHISTVVVPINKNQRAKFT